MGLKYFDEIDWSENLKVASGSVTHTATDNKTTEIKTSVISLATGTSVLPNNKWLLKVETPINDTSGNALVKIYNVDKIDGTNAQDVVRDTTTITNVSAVTSYKDLLVEGLFLGSEKKIKIGITYVTDTTSALVSYYSLYRL